MVNEGCLLKKPRDQTSFRREVINFRREDCLSSALRASSAARKLRYLEQPTHIFINDHRNGHSNTKRFLQRLLLLPPHHLLIDLPSLKDHEQMVGVQQKETLKKALGI